MNAPRVNSSERWRAYLREPAALPEPGFDPRQQDEDTLRRYLLPMRPDPRREPLLAEHWEEMMTPPLHFRRAQFAAELGPRTEPPVLSPSRLESSRNWSGARLAPHGGRRFTAVIGSWRAPELQSIPGAPALAPKCSLWVGLGGHRRWSDAMPQVGTAHSHAFGNDPERHYPWVQWWIRDDLTSGEIPLLAPALGPRDLFLCFLVLLSPQEALFFLQNRATGVSVPFMLDVRTRPRSAAAGVSAQWIVERPRDPPSQELHPLVNYGRVRFSRCAASGGGMETKLRAARLIRMVQKVSVPERSRLISVPRRRGETPGVLRMGYRGP